MPSPLVSEVELLLAVAGACLVTDVWLALGGRLRCHRSTVWRALARAETRELVTRFERQDCDVWELTRRGRVAIERESDGPIPERRPACPSCSSAAGTRLDPRDHGIRYVVLDAPALRCRWCGHTWKGDAAELEAAEHFDRAMHSECDVFAQALRSTQESEAA